MVYILSYRTARATEETVYQKGMKGKNTFPFRRQHPCHAKKYTTPTHRLLQTEVLNISGCKAEAVPHPTSRVVTATYYWSLLSRRHGLLATVYIQRNWFPNSFVLTTFLERLQYRDGPLQLFLFSFGRMVPTRTPQKSGLIQVDQQYTLPPSKT